MEKSKKRIDKEEFQAYNQRKSLENQTSGEQRQNCPEWEKEMAFIYIENLYGINNGHRSYYRKSGDGCFSFTNSKEYASNLTEQEVDEIMKHADWYKNQYAASRMGTELE